MEDSMAIQIDHIVIAGRDLDHLCAQFTAIGLTPESGGTHADGLTHNALIGFADGVYLELIAPTPGSSTSSHAWAAYMNGDAGVCAWAIRSQDINADSTQFRQRGITVSDPKVGGRNRPDGVRLEWITARLGDAPLGSVLPFLIQDVTPREMRVPPATSGPVQGIKGVMIAMRDSTSGIDLFQRAFGGSAPLITVLPPTTYAAARRLTTVGEGLLDFEMEL